MRLSWKWQAERWSGRSVDTRVRLDRVADVLGERAARRERAAGRQVDQRRRRTDDRGEPLLPALVDARQAADQAERVRHPRPVEHVLDGALLDELSCVHHADPIRVAGDHTEVVGDQDESGTGRLARGLQRLQHLGLHRHVERRRRLVRDDHIRVVRHRDRDDDALAHAAGQLMGQVVDPLLGIRDADQFEQLDRPIARGGLGDVVVRQHRLPDLETDRVDRVQRGQRILEDHRDLVAAKARVLLLRLADQLHATKLGRAADPGGLRKQAEQRHRRHRLAGARFTDDAERFTGSELVADAPDGFDQAVVGGKSDGQVVDVEQQVGIGHALAEFYGSCGHG